jgi:predicted nuclease with TOPRIM domain
LADVKERNLQLSARLQQRESDLDEARKDLENLALEKQRLRERVSIGAYS